MGAFCEFKTQPRSGKSYQHNHFCEEEGKLSGQTTSETETRLYCTRENALNMSATLEYTTIKDQKRKVQVDTGADSTVISSFVWTDVGKPQLGGLIRRLVA